MPGPVDSFMKESSINPAGNPLPGLRQHRIQDLNDPPIGANTFYGGITAGVLVKIKDRLSGDRTADEAEFEN